jgi:DNA ligase-1
MPMLANKYKHPDQHDGKTNVKNFPVSVMPKIDGIRALFRRDGSANMAVGRSRNNRKIVHMDHIKDELNVFLTYLPTGSELDGELYSFDMTFNKLTSVVRTEKFKHARHDDVKYFIFDIIDPDRLSWELRYGKLVNAYINYLDDGHSSNTFTIIQAEHAVDHDDILAKHEKYVADGYEGVMVRHYGSDSGSGSECICGSKASKAGKAGSQTRLKQSQYRPNRSNNLLKYKEFNDEEVEIIGAEECTGTEAGAVKFIVRDTRGNEFQVRPRGSIAVRKKWMADINQIIGKSLTIRYQELSDYNVPRFPVGIGIRDYE